MSSAMKQDGTERRSSLPRQTDDRRSGVVRAAQEDRGVVAQRGLAASMSDALEDILRWERSGEHEIHAAADVDTRDAAAAS